MTALAYETTVSPTFIASLAANDGDLARRRSAVGALQYV